LQLWLRHFDNRLKCEQAYFGDPPLPDCPTMLVDGSEINRQVDFVREINPDIVLVFGCGMIRPPLYHVLPSATINLHLGLSPRYRGAATLFWPFYFLEPAWAGATFHRIVNEPDAGDVIHQVVPIMLSAVDTIHDVACKVVFEAAEAMVRLLGMDAWKSRPQRATGKCFLSSDFQPAHLRLIYDTWDDKIVSAYLKGDIEPRQPKVYSQW
jgi:methionyl-tRNA formyltransferase